MAQHISVRVPWHDHGWDGSVCQAPDINNACLRLKNIYENRNDKDEMRLCGQCMEGHEESLPCISEGSAFMSAKKLVRKTIHPYKKSNPKTHSHFLETDLVYPPYSLTARPFAWMMRENIEALAEQYGIDYDASREPVLCFHTNWIHFNDSLVPAERMFFDMPILQLIMSLPCGMMESDVPISPLPTVWRDMRFSLVPV